MRQGYFSKDTAVATPRGIALAVLHGWMGSVAGFPGKPRVQPQQSLLVPFLLQLKFGMMQHPKHTPSPSITGHMMNLHAAQDPH